MKNFLVSLLLASLSTSSYSAYFDDQLELAKQGDAKAQFSLGIMYADGESVQHDSKTAAMWYTKAAEQGLANAQYNLGLMYNNGNGVPENDKTAVMWYATVIRRPLCNG
tara:strand:+ start:1165 stop:1491 length:327 start_codon:yes stop_codon:yes gene_type:complete